VTTVSIPVGSSLAGSRNIIVQCYDNASPANAIMPAGWTVDSSFNVVVTFATAQTGYCALNSSGNPGKYTASFGSTTSLSVLAATHGLGVSFFNVSVYDAATPRNRVDPANVTVDASGNVVVTFAVAQAGQVVIE
jgi:hypothetical protein